MDVSEDFNTGFSAACFCAVYGVLPLGVSMTGSVIGISASSALAQPIPLGKGCVMSLWHPQQAFAQLVALPWALVQSLHPLALVHMHLVYGRVCPILGTGIAGMRLLTLACQQLQLSTTLRGQVQ